MVEKFVLLDRVSYGPGEFLNVMKAFDWERFALENATLSHQIIKKSWLLFVYDHRSICKLGKDPGMVKSSLSLVLRRCLSDA